MLVNWLGDIGGAAASARLIQLLAQTHRTIDTRICPGFRIDVLGLGRKSSSLTA